VHLLPDALQHRQHLHDHATSDDHQITLPRAETKHFGTETRQVMSTGTSCHQFDPATGGRKRHGPQAVLAAPTGQFVELADNDVFWQFYRH
jgi:hypothetical protein